MTVTAHVYEVFIRALRERAWHALVDPGERTSQGAGNNHNSARCALHTNSAPRPSSTSGR